VCVIFYPRFVSSGISLHNYYHRGTLDVEIIQIVDVVVVEIYTDTDNSSFFLWGCGSSSYLIVVGHECLLSI
jgi:hypothetical protein